MRFEFVYAFFITSMLCLRTCAGEKHYELPTHQEMDVRLYQAVNRVTNEKYRAEYAWENPDSFKNPGDVMCGIYINMLSTISPLVRPYFEHYAYGKDHKRFQSLYADLQYSVASKHDAYCGVQFHRTVKEVSPDEAKADPLVQNKKMIKIRAYAPYNKLDNSLFFPAPPHLMVGRMAYVFGHEYGHVLNEYGKDSTFFSPKSLCRYIMHFIIIGGSLLLTSVPEPLFKQHPYLMLGSWLGGLGALLFFSTIQMIRYHRKHAEYRADKTSLHLMPQELHYGPIVFYTESLCLERHSRFLRRDSAIYSLYDSAKHFLKKIILPDYSIHPSTTSRMSRAVHDILALRKPHECAGYLQIMRKTANEAINNYKLQHGDTVIVKESVKGARKEVNRIFRRVEKNMLQIDMRSTYE